MRRVLVVASLLASFVVPTYADDVYVKPHTKKDGTYVDQHHRTAPNDTKYDNYSTKGNTNPWTGQKGTKSPEPDPYKSSYGSEKKKSPYGY